MSAEVFTARRPLTIGGRRYSIGDKIRVKGIPAHKLAQLVEIRFLKAEGSLIPSMTAARNFVIGDKTFKIGDPFPTDSISPEKRAQLLDHRFIRPTQSIQA